MPRWLRVLILFLMVLSLVIYISPLQVEASSIAASIAGVTAVNVPAGLVYAAAVIALGVAVGTNDDFVNMVSNAVSAAGDWVKDGTVELLQTVDAAGQKAYYVAGDMLEDIRSWLYDSEVLILSSYNKYSSGSSASYQEALDFALHCESAYIGTRLINGLTGLKRTYLIAAPSNEFICYSDGVLKCYGYGTSWAECLVDGTGEWSIINTSSTFTYSNVTVLKTSPPTETSLDLSLGYLPSTDTTLTDDTIVSFHPYLTKVIRTGGSGGSDNNGNPKWWVGLALAGTAAAAATMTQQEVYEDTQVEEIPDISYGQEFDFEYDTYIDTSEGTDNGVEKEYIIITPVETPGTGNTEGPEVTEPTTYPYPGTGTNPDTGDTTDPDPGDVTDPDAGDVTDPDAGDVTDPDAGDVTDPDAGDVTDPDSGGQDLPSDLGNYTIDLKDFFPFCIPFDLYDFFTCLNADPVAPVVEWEIYLPGGEVYPLVLDLSVFDSVALLLRRLQLLLFCTGLAFKTRDLIRG